MKDKYSAAFQDAMEYTDLMEAVEKEFSSSILPSMVGQLPTLAFSQMRFGLMAASGKTGMSADAGAKKLQKAIDDMKSDLEKYENIYEECSRIANRKGKKPYWISQMDLEKVQKQSIQEFCNSLLFLKETYGLEEDGATISIFLSREDLANLSNMTTSNAIRTLSIFASEKLIAIDGRKIKIINEEELKKISRIG